MRTPIVILLVVLCVGAAVRSACRFVADEMAWRTNKAVQLSVLAQAQQHLKEAETFRQYPARPDPEATAPMIVAEMNRLAEDEVIDAKNALLRLYAHKGRALSAQETAQASRWKQDVAAWEAVNIRR